MKYKLLGEAEAEVGVAAARRAAVAVRHAAAPRAAVPAAATVHAVRARSRAFRVCGWRTGIIV